MADVLVVAAVLAAALVGGGWLAHRLGIPPAVGYLAVGIIFAPTVHSTPNLPPTVMDAVGELAVLPLLFFIGLELDLRTLRHVLGATAFASVLNIVVPAAAVMAIALLFGWSLEHALILGLAVSLSSTIFGERLAGTPGFPASARRRVLGILVAEDVAAGIILALIAVIGVAGGGAGDFLLSVARLLFLLLLAAAGAILVIPRFVDAVARTHSEELVVLGGLAAIAGFGYIGHAIGSAELGAFLAGMAAAEAGSRYSLRARLHPIRHISLAAFFVVVGLHVTPMAVLQNLGPVVAIACLFLVTKVLVHVPSSMAHGASFGEGLRTSFALGTVGEFSLILASAAAGSGLAHPFLSDYIVGTLVVLLLASPMLMRSVPWLARAAGKTPAHLQRPMLWVMRSMRRSEPSNPQEQGRRQRLVKRLLANGVLLTAWTLLVITAGPRILTQLGPRPGFVALAFLYGTALVVAAPFAVGAYKAYRELVWTLVGLRPGEKKGAGLTRARLIDAWIAFSAVLLLAPITLAFPATLPLFLAALLFAVAVAAVAWRRLTRFHHALEASVARVLGDDPKAGELLDRTLSRYPWGVRFTAVSVPADSPIAGRTLRQARITELTGAVVAVVQRRRSEVVNPPGDHRIWAGDTVVLMGDVHQIARAEALIVASGEALRLIAESHLAQIVEIAIEDRSDIVGKPLGEADVRGRTGTLVIGVWPRDAPHPRTFDPHLMLAPADRLIVLGTPLQVDRARLLAQGLLPEPVPRPEAVDATAFDTVVRTPPDAHDVSGTPLDGPASEPPHGPLDVPPKIRPAPSPASDATDPDPRQRDMGPGPARRGDAGQADGDNP